MLNGVVVTEVYVYKRYVHFFETKKSVAITQLMRISSFTFAISKFMVKRFDRKTRRIHGYTSHVRVGRGSDKIDQSGSWAGPVTPKPPVN